MIELLSRFHGIMMAGAWGLDPKVKTSSLPRD